MKVSGKNMTMTRGDSEVIVIECSLEDGTAMPFLEGDTVYFTVKETIRDEEKVLQKVITEFTDGKAIINIEPEDTKSLLFKTYVYDVQLTTAEGTVRTIIPPSKFTIGGEVTYD